MRLERKESPAFGLIAHLWNNAQDATGHSFLRLNQGLHEGLFLAVKIGLEFAENDIQSIAEQFRGGYWFGSNMESFYQCAVVYSNASAWKAYEAYTERKPFIWKPATLRQSWGGGDSGTVNPARLTVGCGFSWKGEEVKVTSFNDKKGYLVATSYTRENNEDCETCGHTQTWGKEKILHRHTITHEDLKAERARLKAA